MADLKTMTDQQLRELLAEKKKLMAEQRIPVKQSKDEWTAYAQSLIDKLFEVWHVSGDWIKSVHKLGAKNLTIFSPIGQPRHLWGYLHQNRSVVAAMNRRGPNSIIQGLSSQIGYIALYTAGREYWRTFARKGIDLGFLQCNSVHDSSTSEIDYVAAPIGMYLVEHAMTTLVAEHYRTVYGYNTVINHLIDMEFGLNEAELIGWSDQRFDSAAKSLKAIGEKAGESPERIAACLHNLARIGEVRLEELRTDPFKMTLRGRTDWFLRNMKGLKIVPPDRPIVLDRRKIELTATRRPSKLKLNFKNKRAA